MSKPVVLAMTGASGAIYAQRLLRTLLESDVEVHLTISPSGAAVISRNSIIWLTSSVSMPRAS